MCRIKPCLYTVRHFPHKNQLLLFIWHSQLKSKEKKHGVKEAITYTYKCHTAAQHAWVTLCACSHPSLPSTAHTHCTTISNMPHLCHGPLTRASRHTTSSNMHGLPSGGNFLQWLLAIRKSLNKDMSKPSQRFNVV